MLKYLTLLLTLIALPAFGQTLGGGTVGIPGLTTNAVRERHLKAVDAPADEECLTYESTVGDFEWQNCTAGALSNVVEDTTPQLGGPLAVSGFEITGAIDLHSTGDVILELGDNAAANKVIINDSDGAEVATIDSDGDVSIRKLVTTGIVGVGTPIPDAELEIFSADPTLRLRDSGPTATSTTAFMEFGGTDAGVWVRTGYVGDSSTGNADIMLRAEIGELHLGDATNNQAIIISSGNIDLHSAGDVILELGDNAGVNKVIINDSDSAEVATINSDGVITAVDLTVDLDVLHVDAADDFIGIGTATSNTDNQVLIRLSGTKDILVDGTTNNRNIDTGAMRFEQTPAIENTRALTLNINANSQPNTHAVVINVLATGIEAGELISAYDVNIDKNTSTGGVVRAFEVSQTGAGSIEVTGLHSDPGVALLTQQSGTFGAIEQAFTYDGAFADTTAAFNATGTDVSLFVGNGDFVYIGDAATFNGVSVVLDTFASNPGVKTNFAFSDGIGGWTAFPPSDETQGFRQDGLISWVVADLVGWAADTVNGVAAKYWIRFERDTAAAITVPIEDIIQIASSTSYGWDEDGVLDVANINIDPAVNASSDWNYRFTNPAGSIGLDIVSEINPSSASSGMHYGIFSEVALDASATEVGGHLIGLEADSYARPGATVTSLTGVRALTSEFGASTATDAFTFYGFASSVTTLTNNYGLYLEDFSSGASSINEAIHVEGGDINLAASGQYLAPSGSTGAPSYADALSTSGMWFRDPGANTNVVIEASGTGGIDFNNDGIRTAFIDQSGNVFVAMNAQPGIIGNSYGAAAVMFRVALGDDDSGLGGSAADTPHMIAGGVNAVTWTEASNHVIVKNETHVGLTANSGGGGVGSCLQLLSSYNEISVSAAPGDSVCAPTAVAGQPIFIINNGASAVDIYPFTSDNLGGGVDTAVSLPAGSNIRYFAIDGVNWEVM